MRIGYWIIETTKIFLLVSLALVLYISYADGIKPYRAAINETKSILKQADIPYKTRAIAQYNNRALTVLKQQCQHGVYQTSYYEFRCADTSPFRYILSTWMHNVLDYAETES